MSNCRKLAKKYPPSKRINGRLGFTTPRKDSTGLRGFEHDECATYYTDETSRKCVIGGAGHHGTSGRLERRLPVDSNGKFKPVAQGGKCPEKKPEVKPKHDDTVHVVFGVAAPMKRAADGRGQRVVHKSKLFPYTGAKVVGMKAHKKAQEEEIKRVKKMKGVWWRHRNADNPYEPRHGDDWKAQMKSNTQSTVHKLTCISEISTFIFNDAFECFKGTTGEGCFKVYRDGLKQWCEHDHIDFLKEKGWWEHCVVPRSGILDDTRYGGDYPSIPGNQHDTMPLDAHLFKDLYDIVHRNVVLTARADKDELGKFSMATPRLLYHAMERAATKIPDKRVIEDIDKVWASIEKIVQAGTGGALAKAPGRRSQKKVLTMDTVHEDAMPCFNQMRATIRAGQIAPNEPFKL